MNKHVSGKLEELVGQGVSSVSEMRRHLRIYVETVLFKDEDNRPSITDLAYNPTDVIIRQHIYVAQLRFR